MDTVRLYEASFVNWEAVGTSWAKRTVSSRLLLLAARRYLRQAASELYREDRAEIIAEAPLPDEVRDAFSSPPSPENSAAGLWGEFVDAALAAELEIVSYGERPPLLHELRTGLEAAAAEVGDGSVVGRWFLARRDALPGTDLPEDPGYIPI